MKGSTFESLPLKRQGGLATGKIDGCLQPSSSLVASRAFQAPAYVNSDCGAKAVPFDRIQVNALVRMVTAVAGMVEVGPVSKKNPCGMWGDVARQYSSANMIVSTRLTMGLHLRP